ncbi:MAG TPA: glycosyltransferase [Phycisphaerales bacterium]|nr:glycosyltransferase [Phycisphaerales bacterium]
MNVCVVSEIRPPSHLAHAINVVKTAGGFARHGHGVTILCRPPEDGHATATLAPLYGETAIEWAFAPASIDADDPAAFAHWAVAEAERRGASLVYARHFHGAQLAAEHGLATILETHAHAGSVNPSLDECCRTTQSYPLVITTISERLRADYLARGAAPGRIIITPDGVDVDLFARPEHRPNIPNPYRAFGAGPHVVYAGHLYDYKGIPTILDGAKLAPDITFHLVGGLRDDVERVHGLVRAGGLANVHVHGARPHTEVPAWLWHADVLLLPPSANHPSAAWTSPLKLGEYLASGMPIVASRIPALMDWVDERVVRWFTPDDAGSLCASVHEALSSRECEKHGRQTRAMELAKSFSYEARAGRMLNAAGSIVADRHGQQIRLEKCA